MNYSNSPNIPREDVLRSLAMVDPQMRKYWPHPLPKSTSSPKRCRIRKYSPPCKKGSYINPRTGCCNKSPRRKSR